MALPALSFQPSTLMGSKAADSASGFPDWVFLCEEPRFSERRNETTAKCRTGEGQAVEVSFWLVDPPGVSYFTFNCPGLDASVFHEKEPPSLVCAAAAFVVFCLSFRGSIHHFVYRAAPAGKQSLQLLPDRDPSSTVFRRTGFGLLPCADGEHYAVAYIDRQCLGKDSDWWFHAHVFSSETRAWSSHRVSLRHLSKSERLMCCRHGLSQQIAVAGSLGWVDLMRGIVLLCNLLDGNPVIKFIPFPESRVSFLDEDGRPELAPQYYCNVACCGDLIKFIEVEFDDPVVRTSGIGWRATLWERKISWDKWEIRSTVDVANISVDQSFSAVLPGLWCDETQKLDLKKLIFYTPLPSRRDDDLFYMVAKVNADDETAWAIAVDMERAAVEAMAQFSLGRYKYHIAMYSSCDFPKYLNMTPGADMYNPVDKCSKRMSVARLSAKQCVVQVLRTLDWLQELDQCLEIERSTDNAYRLLLQFSPVSSLCSSIRPMVKYASQGEAASKAVDFCRRALEDFDLALHGSPSDPSASVETMRSKISDVIQALDNVMQIVPSTLIPKERMLGDASDQKRSKATSETLEKPFEAKNTVYGWLLLRLMSFPREWYQVRRRWMIASREQRQAVVNTKDKHGKWRQRKYEPGNSRREKRT
ncbi:hypothetical protein CFC21_045698 [Triticum aestivum]|uniref:DUF1618 domain-containing protein n=2 Tax=Triticum aestivum TaxID=4565 RepID=A0A9R1FUF0_WHEAT|nr:uncharacterized protein LOC123077022 [Triticum aestivum]KAF7034718.1 hypothetical protein CFC21_045698 [Triticum aestivum]